MTDLANASTLLKSSAQLPVDWYLSSQMHALEKNILFGHGPGYVGHELMVPNPGDYYALEWLNNAKLLVRNEHGVELMSNICRHRQTILKKGRGNARNIVCPLHRWTYAMDGKLLGAPLFPETPCLNLGKTPLQNWNGLLFGGPRDVAQDLAGMNGLGEFDFSGYMLDRVQIDEHPINWKTFIEVYLEDYHVSPFHPGLDNFVDCNNLKWEFGDRYSVQTVGVSNKLSRPGTPVYQRWHDQVLKYHDGKLPEFGAIWMVYYPNVMIELYPHVMVVSTLIPRTAESCANVVEFYYPEEIVLFEREFVEAHQAAYAETGREDDVICVSMTEGRKALYEQGLNEVGPYQSPMEDGMQHFHEFLQRELKLQTDLFKP